MKLYILANNKDLAPTGTEDIDGIYSLISEEGEHLYDHWCSCRGYAKGDLVLHRPNRIKDLKDKYGDYQVLHLGEDDMTLERLKELYDNYYKNEPLETVKISKGER